MTESEFYSKLQESEPGREYLDLISSCLGRTLKPESGFEIHHKFLTSLGGKNVSENKVKLTVFEHCRAHALLAKAIPCFKTLQPITRMSSGQVQKLEDLEKVTLEEQLEWSKLRYKALHFPRTQEFKEKDSQSHLGLKMSKEHVEKRTAKRLGTVTVTDGEVTKYVTEEKAQELVKQGWKRGISEYRRQRLQESHKGLESTSRGRICIYRETQERKIFPEELEKFELEGWKKGRNPSFNIKRQEFFKNNSIRGTKVRIRRDGVGKIVPKVELQKYLDEGWKLGMVKHS